MIKVTKTEFGTVYALTGVTGGGGTHTTHTIPNKEWVSLTVDEVKDLSHRDIPSWVWLLLKDVEEKLKEKNK
jgi:hypothetical protein